MNDEGEKLDDRQTSQSQANNELRELSDGWFDADAGATALALGREPEQIEAALDGAEIDEDLLMKIRRIKDERPQGSSE